MGIFWVFVSRIRVLVFRNRMERDLEDELQAHLELLELEYRRSGMDPDQAARAARLRLCGAEQTKEKMRDENIGHPLLV